MKSLSLDRLLLPAALPLVVAIPVLKWLVHGDKPAARPRATASPDADPRSAKPRRRRAGRRARTLSHARDVYAHDGAGLLSPVVRHDPARIYVPNSESNSVDVIDPATVGVVAHFGVGALPQHVTPSYDLKTLYVLDDAGNKLIPIDPRTARPRKPISVADPYNLYVTTDGRSAIVVAERLHRLDFRDPHTFALRGSMHVPRAGVNHMDFSAGGRIYAQDSTSPVLELAVTDVSYGSVASGDVDVSPPTGAKVVELGSSHGESGSSTPAVTGLDAVSAAAGFPVVAPGSLVGLPREDVRLVGGKTALVFYGQGLGGIALVERKADESGPARQLSGLPAVSLDGVTAHELATQLGTVLEWQTGGTTYVLAGSLPPAAAEAAARAVK
jgi:YVTN family beta-propeller protein